MPPILAVNQPLPYHPEYASLATARKFWRVSFECGRNYLYSEDARGNPILYKHEREQKGYDRRQRTTKARNHAGPIIRRYNDFAFRTPATRPESDSALYATILEDADAQGTPLDSFMKEATRVAQIDRDAYLLPDSTKPEGQALSQAQAAAAGVRPFLRRIDADAVLWWRDYDGVMVEALVLYEDEDGQPFATLYGPKVKQRIEIKATAPGSPGTQWNVIAIGPEEAHEYGGCQLVRLRPSFDGDSQIAPLAESQQAITNYISLLNEEIFNVTFSQIVATGVAATDVKDVILGTTRLLCLPNPQASFEMLGADPAQAESIRKAIEDEQRELYRIAGVSTGDPTAGPAAPESGIAKAFKFNDLAANLSALAKSAQDAENLALSRMFAAQGEPFPGPAEYPKTFDLPEMAVELTEVIKAITIAQLPGVLKRKMVQRFAQRNFKLDEAEQAELKQQAEALSEPVDETNPMPGRKPGT